LGNRNRVGGALGLLVVVVESVALVLSSAILHSSQTSLLLVGSSSLFVGFMVVTKGTGGTTGGIRGVITGGATGGIKFGMIGKILGGRTGRNGEGPSSLSGSCGSGTGTSGGTGPRGLSLGTLKNARNGVICPIGAAN